MIETIHRAVRFSYIVLGLYWFSLFVSTHIPLRTTAGDGLPNADKVIHLFAYSVLAFLLSCALHRSHRKSVVRNVIVLALASVYAIIDEATQMFVPSRVADIWDCVADMIGAGIGIAMFALALIVVRRFTRITLA